MYYRGTVYYFWCRQIYMANNEKYCEVWYLLFLLLGFSLSKYCTILSSLLVQKHWISAGRKYAVTHSSFNVCQWVIWIIRYTIALKPPHQAVIVVSLWQWAVVINGRSNGCVLLCDMLAKWWQHRNLSVCSLMRALEGQLSFPSSRTLQSCLEKCRRWVTELWCDWSYHFLLFPCHW